MIVIQKKIILFICLLLALTFQRSECSEAEQIRIGVMPFLSRTEAVSERQAAFISDIITRNFQASPSIAVIERERLRVIAIEQGLNVSSGSDEAAAKLGQTAGCKYILLGSITQLRQRYISSTKLSWFLGVDKGDTNESQEASAALEARLLDVATGKVILSFSQSGTAIISDTVKPYTTGRNYSHDDLTMRAVEAACSRLADKVREAAVNEYAEIISINKNNIRINRGSTSGVNIGALYKVYQEGGELFDLDGKSLGKRIINLALLKVINVSGEFSTVEILNRDQDKQDTKKSASKKKAKVTKSKEVINTPVLIHEGDKIEAVSFSEAENLKLASQRL